MFPGVVQVIFHYGHNNKSETGQIFIGDRRCCCTMTETIPLKTSVMAIVIGFHCESQEPCCRTAQVQFAVKYRTWVELRKYARLET